MMGNRPRRPVRNLPQSCPCHAMLSNFEYCNAWNCELGLDHNANSHLHQEKFRGGLPFSAQVCRLAVVWV
jgi:hypothetical protein